MLNEIPEFKIVKLIAAEEVVKTEKRFPARYKLKIFKT
tara:strand:- start:23797 stop:23910 length:114 start_codon:yes stop_codon:yes gene_type:complete